MVVAAKLWRRVYLMAVSTVLCHGISGGGVAQQEQSDTVRNAVLKQWAAF